MAKIDKPKVQEDQELVQKSTGIMKEVASIGDNQGEIMAGSLNLKMEECLSNPENQGAIDSLKGQVNQLYSQYGSELGPLYAFLNNDNNGGVTGEDNRDFVNENSMV